MSVKITKLVVGYLLNHGIKSSELRDWQFKVREVDGVYIFDVSTSVAIAPKTQLTREERTSKTLLLTFAASFCTMVVLSTIGLFLPDAVLGRELVYVSTFPGFIAQLIGARLLVGRYHRSQRPRPYGPSIESQQGRTDPEANLTPLPVVVSGAQD